MEPSRHLDLLRLEGARLAAMPADALEATVPTVPDWDVERVVRHVGKVHRWVVAALDADPDDPPATIESLPHGPACLDAYAEALDAVVDALATRSPDEPAWTFAGPGTAAFWMRRQAHEVAVHRIDAADAVHAAGGPAPDPLEADGAADGIDEWADLFLGARFGAPGSAPEGLVGRTVHVHGTDHPAPVDGAEWLFSFTDDGVTVERSHAKGDVALRGPAADLLPVVWRRRPLDDVEVVGDRAVAEHLLDAARF